MKFIDSHSHIYSEEFDADIDDVMLRAKESDVYKILLPNIDLDSIPRMMNLVSKYPDVCFPMMGLHPCYVDADYKNTLKKMKEYLSVNKYCAIGEIGIDLYWDKTYLEEQKEVFAEQIKWSIDLDLPIVIHVRDAFDEVFEVLDSFACKSFKGVFHSFTGNLEQAEKALGLGFYLGINGIITFKNSSLGGVVAQMPLEKLLIETDSPYLSPVPKRGKRNESANLVFIAQKIAEVLNTNIENVVAKTTKNTEKLFNV